MSASSEMFPSPSVNLGRIEGGEALNSVPDTCRMWVDIRCLPEQDRTRDRRQDPGHRPGRRGSS